jgi:hypothetical protein
MTDAPCGAFPSQAGTCAHTKSGPAFGGLTDEGTLKNARVAAE